MKIRRVKKTLSAFGLLLAVMLACVAVSLAQDGTPIGLSHSFGIQHSYPGNASTVDGYALRVGLVPPSGNEPICFPRNAQTPSVVQAPFNAAGRFVQPAGAKPRKVGLHLLDSVLLI